MEDEELITLLEARSEAALTALNARFGPLCRRIARQVLGSAEDAEECVDDAWMAVWRAIPPEHPQQLTPYVCRITRNLAVTRLRRQTSKKRFSPYTAALDELADVLTGGHTPEEELNRRELTKGLTSFLDGLPRDDRVLFMRRYWYGDPVADLARRFGWTRSGTAVRLHRLRGRLRSELEKEGIL